MIDKLKASTLLVLLALMTHTALAKAPAADCSPLKLADRRALTSWEMPNGTTLVVCSFGKHTKTKSELSREFAGWVNLFWKEEDKVTVAVPEVNSRKMSPSYLFSIEKTAPDRVAVTRTHISRLAGAGESNTAITESTIQCASKQCTLGPEVCIKQPQRVYKKAIMDLTDVVEGKKKSKDLDSYETTLDQVAKSAMAGDQDALKLFLTQSDKFKTDGALAVAFHDDVALINDLVKFGCVQKPAD